MNLDLGPDRETSERLLYRATDLADQLDAVFHRGDPEIPIGAPTVLARTTTKVKYPTSAATFFACTPLTLLGAEVEGGAGTIGTGAGTIMALNIGGAIPVSGTTVLLTFVASRWLFRYDSCPGT